MIKYASLADPAVDVPTPKPRRTASDRQPHFLRAWRQSRGLTLRELAAAVNKLRGAQIVTAAQLSRVETGEREYRQDLLEAIAEALTEQGGSVVLPGDLISREPFDPLAIEEEILRSPANRLRREIEARERRLRPINPR